MFSTVKAWTEKCKTEKRRFSVSGVLRKLGLSKSNYHDWVTRKPSNQEKQRTVVKNKIKSIWNESKQIYGAPNIAHDLWKLGFHTSVRTVSKYMKQLGIRACWIKKYKPAKAASLNDKLHNILEQQFNPERPDAVWCTDITYIWTGKGFVYLSSIMDLFSRKIIAWKLSDSLEEKFVIETIEMAKKRRRITKPLVIHSDRGSHYIADEYKKACRKMTRSYSKKHYPWDNACIESFHAIIKREWIYRFQIRDLEHCQSLVFEYIESFYNLRRNHSHCGYISPNEFENLYWSKNCKKIAI